MKFKNLIFLILIMVLAIILRFSFFNQSPPSLNWDEASLGYNAYSIVKTGKDEWGRSFPLTFEAFGDYKLPVYIYMLTPFVALFGLNEFSVRLLSQIAGVLAVLFVYLITKKLFKDSFVSIGSAFLLAISPWHVFFSRAALEANLAFTLFLAGLYFFLKGFEKGSYLTISAILFGLTVFTYNSARVFVPLFLIGLILLNLKQLKSYKINLIVPGLILGIFIALAGFLAIFQDSSSRYYWVSIVDQGAVNYLNESRTSSTFPEIVTKLIYNRYVYFIHAFIQNYLSHFSLEFLFLKGGTNHQFSVPNNGILYLFELPLLILGAVKIFGHKYAGRILILWLLLAPIPSAITREAPHALRSIFMLGSIQIITAYGLFSIRELLYKMNKITKNLLLFVGTTVVLVSFAYYFYNYFFVYPKKESESWQYGYEQAVDYVSKEADQNSKIYFTKRYGEAHIFYLFYSQYDPAKYQNNKTLIRYAQTNWRWVDKLDNITFINNWEVQEKLKSEKSVLLIAAPGDFPKQGKIIKSIYFLNGSKAFDVVQL